MEGSNENVNCRLAYQRGATCVEAFKNTRDPKYLNHARHLLIDKILASQERYGLIGAVNDEQGRIDGEQSWMMALYADTLWKLLKEAPDAEAARKLALLADFLDQCARKMPGKEEYWNSRGLVAGVYAYAFDLIGDPRYRNLAIATLDEMWSSNEAFGHERWGKASCQALKSVPHAAALVAGPTP